MPGNARQLRHVERPGAHRDELRREGVAAVGADDPAGATVVPLELGHARVEERVVVEPELPPDPPAVLEDLRPVRVLLGRHVPRLLEQRHVDEGGRVALRARVAVPVPGAAEVAALLDDADVVDAGLLQPRAGHEPGEAAADDRDRDVVGLGIRAARPGVYGIFQVVIETAFDLDVLLVAVGAEALGALLGVLLFEGFFVDGAHGCLHSGMAGTLAGARGRANVCAASGIDVDALTRGRFHALPRRGAFYNETFAGPLAVNSNYGPSSRPPSRMRRWSSWTWRMPNRRRRSSYASVLVLSPGRSTAAWTSAMHGSCERSRMRIAG